MTVSQPLIYALWPTAQNNLQWRQLFLVVSGTVLLAVSAKIQIPFWPVPTTMQSFTVILLAALYGRRLGTATILLYLLEGILGFPVFANSSWHTMGLAYLAAPTGGYLVGFIMTAYVIGALSEHQWGKKVGSAGLLFMIGLFLIDVAGSTWLVSTLGFTKTVPVVLSYQLASLMKIGLGAGLLPILWKRYQR